MTAPSPPRHVPHPAGSANESLNESGRDAPAEASSSPPSTGAVPQTRPRPAAVGPQHDSETPPNAPTGTTSWLKSWLKRIPIWGAVLVGFGLGVLGYGSVVATWMAKIVLPAFLLGWMWKAALRRRSSSRWLRSRLTSHGTGFYGLVASATFAVKQTLTFIEELPEGWATLRALLVPLPDPATLLDVTSAQLWQAAVEGFIGLSAETILNGAWSMMWPVSWLMHLGYAQAGLLVAGLYGIYRITLRLSPEVRLLLAFRDEETPPTPGSAAHSS